jgi:hypothetical protein
MAGEKLLDDNFYEAVVPDECNWQIEDLENGTRRLWINIFKRVPTSKQNHWKHILSGDENSEKFKSADSICDHNNKDSKKMQ